MLDFSWYVAPQNLLELEGAESIIDTSFLRVELVAVGVRCPLEVPGIRKARYYHS